MASTSLRRSRFTPGRQSPHLSASSRERRSGVARCTLNARRATGGNICGWKIIRARPAPTGAAILELTPDVSAYRLDSRRSCRLLDRWLPFASSAFPATWRSQQQDERHALIDRTWLRRGRTDTRWPAQPIAFQRGEPSPAWKGSPVSGRPASPAEATKRQRC
jgi:hypothetical protein